MGSIEAEKRVALDNEVLDAQIQLWNHVLSFLKSMSLKCALDLGIPDALHRHGGPITLPDLVAALSVPDATAGSVRRLMRSLAHSGLFAMHTNVDGEESYALTPTSRLLVTEERTCLSPFARKLLDPIMMEPAHALGSSIKRGEPSAFVSFHKKTVFDVCAENPRFNDLLNQGAACDARLVAELMRRGSGEVLFRGVRSLVDVGGGTGTMAVAIAEAFPHVKCTAFDLPHVIATAPKNTAVNFVGGDMFETIPKADAILLKWILHDWNDEECIKILNRCKEAIPSKGEGGKIIIIDMIMDTSIDNPTSIETQFLFDLEMMLLLTGKERDEGEWQKIFSGAGFSDYKITQSLGLRSVIELYP